MIYPTISLSLTPCYALFGPSHIAKYPRFLTPPLVSTLSTRGEEL